MLLLRSLLFSAILITGLGAQENVQYSFIEQYAGIMKIFKDVR